MTAAREQDVWLAGVPAVAQLFPPGTRRLTYRPGRSPCLLVLPSTRSPRLLVPSDLGTSDKMLRRHNTTRMQRFGQDVVALALRSRLLPMLPVARLVPVGGADGATIEAHVRRHVPEAARVGVLLGPPRANAKPVLRIFGADGSTVAFGKVGHDALSARLVRAESAVLGELSVQTFRHLEAPRVIHTGTWHGLEVLLITPMQASVRREASWELPLAAMRELTRSTGLTTGPVATSPYAVGLTERVNASGRESGVPAVLDGVQQLVGHVVLHYGRWHGDWAPWNTGSTAGSRLQVWDWERSSACVPVGFDAVHFLLQREFESETPTYLLGSLLREATWALEGLGVHRDQVEATILLYLVEILQRYVADAGGTPTMALQHRLSTIRALTASISGNLSREFRADA